MQRDKRVEDNWSLIVSQYIALKHKVPLYVCFQYVGEYKESNIRHYEFLFKGLHQTASDLQSKNINFIILKGLVGKVIPQLIESKKIGILYDLGNATKYNFSFKDDFPLIKKFVILVYSFENKIYTMNYSRT